MTMSERSRKHRPATLAVHAGVKPDPRTGAVMTPIYASATFAQSSPGVHTGWEYARTGNPTRAAFEAAIAELEGGSAGFAFASGLAAEATLLELLDQGSHIVAGDDLYGGTWRLFERVRKRSAGLSITYADPADTGAIEAAIGPKTRMIWVESPTNPLLKIADLAAIAEIGKARGILTVADSTFASPMIQRPLELGFDIVLHSATKYLNGHSDIVAGTVAVRGKELADRIRFLQNAAGAVLDPYPSFLALRGLKTLALRMERHSANALAVAKHLEGNRKIRRVIYPSLFTDPDQIRIRDAQTDFPGSILSLELKGGKSAAFEFLRNLKVGRNAVSLGGVETLVCHPMTTTHSELSGEELRAAGIGPDLVRISIGTEHWRDLLDDFTRALESC